MIKLVVNNGLVNYLQMSGSKVVKSQMSELAAQNLAKTAVKDTKYKHYQIKAKNGLNQVFWLEGTITRDKKRG